MTGATGRGAGACESLHAEDAERGAWDRRVQGRGDAQAERVARLERVQDAVVPQASRRVIRAALGFVLGTDRGGEGVGLVRAEVPCGRSELLLLHGEERLRGLLAAHDRG